MPDNRVLDLTYLDPTTNNLATCNVACPLSHDPSIPYQDFLFTKGTYFTSFTLSLLTNYGPSSGLHLLQLLSDGTAAYAVERYNNGGEVCFSGIGSVGGVSTAKTNGTWVQDSVAANVPGTAEDILYAMVSKGTNAASAASLTWDVYIPSDGIYDVHFYTPGCWRRGDCAQRGTVEVMVSPEGNGAQPNSTLVDQTNQNDLSSLVYSGALLASTSVGSSGNGTKGGLNVELSLANGGADGKDIEMIADKIVLYAQKLDGTIVKGTMGRGVWEYVQGGSGAFGDGTGQGVDADGILQGSGTGLDRVGAGMSSAAVVSSVVVASDVKSTILGGTFRYSNSSATTPTTQQNIVATSPLVVPAGGLNGPVEAMLISGGYLFVGGPFTASADNSITGLQGLVRWRYATAGSTWEAIGQGSGLGGNVTGLAVQGGSLYVAGAGNQGLAVYDIAGSKWVGNPFGAGSTFVGNLTTLSPFASDGTAFLAGNVVSSSANLAPRNSSCTPSPSIGNNAKSFHSIGVVILISMAISLGIVFFGVLLCLLIALILRHRRGGNDPDHAGWGAAAYSSGKGDDGDSVDLRHRPTSLLATINAATAAMHEKQMMNRRGATPSSMGMSKGGKQTTPRSMAGAAGAGAAGVGLGLSGHGRDREADEDEEDAEEGAIGAGGEDGPDYRRARWSFQEERVRSFDLT